MCVAKTKALISFAVTAKLVCAFVFAYAVVAYSDCWFSHAAAHFSFLLKLLNRLSKKFAIYMYTRLLQVLVLERNT